jgi:hypothetical protein
VQWFGRPVNFNRFLGQVDSDDPTNLPVGLAAVCRNTDFTRDSPGVTCAGTRAGINAAMQLVALDGTPSAKPVTGAVFFAFSPELTTQSRFEMPIAFELGGCLQRENPVGTGRMQKIATGTLYVPPANTSMLAVPAENKVWAAFSNLKEAGYGASCIDPNVIQTGVPVVAGIAAVNPLGMKPVGWYWQPNTPVLVGEMCCPPAPSTGNGHTYRCIQAGTTGAAAPVFPTTESTVFDDRDAQWQEYTMVMANRLPAPPLSTLSQAAGGAFPAGDDIYVVVTLVNDQGESLPSPAAVFVDTVLNMSLQVNFPTSSLPGWLAQLGTQYAPTGWNIYTASVATGSPAPSISSYQRVNSSPIPYANPSNTFPSAGTGAAPPTRNSARITPGQLPTPDVEPEIERDPAAGTFAAGRDVYVLQTYTNSVGETKGGPANVVVDTVANDGIQVTVTVPEDENGNALYDIATVGIYEADVPTGTPAPPATEFSLVGYYAAGATSIITDTATGANPPEENSTGPGGAIVADTATGGPNNTQGYRYAALLFMNQNETVSGFTIASVIQYDVDEDGWELAFFNIAVGPGNIVARLVAPTVADGSQDGPFTWLGLIDLIEQSQNVVYPMTVNSNGIEESATAIFDNVTTTATYNFDDDFLLDGNNVDDRTDILPPFQPVRIDYLKSINSLAYTGVKGYTGGGLISIPGDPESVYADTGELPFPSDGQRCYGFTDAYKSVIFALREEGGFVVEPNTGNPASWTVVRRWSDVGPCGFRAWDANGKYIVFVHRSGFYKYDESDPDMMSKEVPRQWSTINWAAAEQIAVTIDEDTHTVRIQVPVGGSMVNNAEFCLSYLEGWQNPIHFSTFSGKEISMDAARRWSFNDIAATMCLRMNRTLPPGPAFVDGPDWTTMPDASYRVSQLLYCTSGYDGCIHARSPGVYSDNGTGIDWQWETTSASIMQAVCKPEGFNLNITGHGLIYPSFLPARVRSDGPAEQLAKILKMQPIALVNGQQMGVTRKCPPRINEFWRVGFSNGKQVGAWASLKQMTAYMIPFSGGRDSGDRA